MKKLSLKCKCGHVQGLALIRRAPLSRAVCYCDDCQTFAHFLKQGSTLDRNGGTEVFPVAPADITLSQGQSELRCLRLSPQGLYRWYTNCCNTAVANCPSNTKVPYVGIVHTFWNADDEQTLRILGPIQTRLQGQFAIGKPPEGTPDKLNARALLQVVMFMAWGFIRRAHTPSPFFKNGEPVSPPMILSKEQRQSLQQLCGPHPKSLLGFN